ncbi:sulfatase-like hydrolase/transferase [Flexithrix dorotheae]|uniref:sulfatase-like hydrolase/transferase n=1 Tax=Flexithrix dorotheae TaxID=70993 RepID=UPI0012FAB19E|nr:sulfatase-like hydrolase/transferase [Flexithrix dorotheae]
MLIKNVIFFILLVQIMVACYPVYKSDEKPPNIIIILTDDQQFDAVGHNANPIIQTPALDNFASKSMQFYNANVAFALCSPSRAAILTGRYGSANGVLELGSKLNSGEVSIGQYLKDAGYITGFTGKWHIDQQPQQLGFDFHSYFYSNGTYYGRKTMDMGKTIHPENHCDEYAAKRAIDFLRENSQKENPMFLMFCTQTPHMDHRHTWPAKQATMEKYKVEEMPVPKNHKDNLAGKPEFLKTVRNRTQALKYGYPDSTAIQTHTRDYYAVISEMDDFISGVVEEIERLNLSEDTYIFFLSDNGWMLGDHGFTSKVLPYRPSAQIPFWVKGPGIKKNTQQALVSNIDLAPTIMELAGLEVPDNMHGKSLLPILKGESEKVRETFVYEGLGNYGGAKPNLTVINENFRYITTYQDNSLQEVIFEELYHQQNDLLEMENLIDHQEYDDLKMQLKNALEKHKTEILNGHKTSEHGHN